MRAALDVHGGLRAAWRIRSRHAYASTRCAYDVDVADMENAGRCRNGNERAQPSGSSWRPSRVAARLYCSNKSYHPAITAPITSPRDEYILACSPASSFSPSSASLYVVRCCSVSQHPCAAHFIRAIVPSNCLSLLLFLLLFFLASPTLFILLRSFLVLPSTPRRTVLIRLTVLARHASRLIPLLSTA